MRKKIHGYTKDLRAVYKSPAGLFIVVHDAKLKRHCLRIRPEEIAK